MHWRCRGRTGSAIYPIVPLRQHIGHCRSPEL